MTGPRVRRLRGVGRDVLGQYAARQSAGSAGISPRGVYGLVKHASSSPTELGAKSDYALEHCSHRG